MRSDRERLLDILEAIERINRYASLGRSVIQNNELIQSWVVSHIQNIGEASFAMSQGFKASNSQVPWKEIIGMRHILVHSYFAIDLDVVVAVLENDIPRLKSQIEAMLANLPSP